MTDTIQFIGNATTLLRCAGFTVLTDPNFLHLGKRVHLGYGLHSRRLREPALQPEELPALDAVVLSHLHGDHFDGIARRKLDHTVPLITTPHAARRLYRWGFDRTEGLDTWQTTTLRNADGGELRITSLPGRHAFGVLGRLLPPVMGSLLEFRTEPAGPAYRVYITGDTLFHAELAEIGQRYPDIAVGLLHLGGTKVLGATVTMDGRQGVDLLSTVSVRTAMPIHYDDYTLMKSPLTDFLAESGRRLPEAQITVLERGAVTPLPA